MLKNLLMEMKTTAEQARAAGLYQLPPATSEQFIMQYRALLALAASVLWRKG